MQRLWSYRFTLGFLLLTIVLGVYARGSGILKGYFAFTFDQGRDFLILQEMVDQKTLHLIGPPTGIEGVFHGVWWHWVMLPVFWISGGNPKLVLILFSTLLTTATLVSAWYFGKRLANRISAVVMVSLVSTSLFYIGTHVQLWHPNVVPLFTPLLSWAVLVYLQTKKHFFLIPLILGVIFEFGLGFGLLFLPAFLLTLIITKSLPSLKTLLLGSVGLGFWFLPRIIFDLRNHFLQIKSFIFYISTRNNIPSASLFVRFQDRLQTAFFVFKDAFGGRNYVIAFLLLLLVTGFSLWIIRYKGEYRKFFLFQLLLVGLTILAASFYPKPLWDYYLIGMPSLLLPLLVVCLSFVIRKWRVIGWLLTIFLLIINLKPEQWFRGEWEGDASVYRNQLAVVETIFADAQHKQFNVQVYSPSVIDYTYHYLFLWYGKRFIGYSPNRDSSEKLLYLIVEPEKWNPVLQEAWLRDREGDGKTVWKSDFRGGIKVEKRERN